MRIDFPNIPDPTDFNPVPAGRYKCVLRDVQEQHTQSGDDMWRLQFIILEGTYKGRIIFDNMVFSTKAMGRVKLICSRLGFDMSVAQDVTPSMMKGRQAFITVTMETYNGQQQNKIPFAGYEKIEDQPAVTTVVAPLVAQFSDANEDATSDANDDIPF